MNRIEKKILKFLKEQFEYPEDKRRDYAKKMARVLVEHDNKWISVRDALPEPQDIYDTGNEYYKVKVENFGEHRAMYLIDENDETGWYTSYIHKLVKPVTHFMPTVD